MSGFESVLVANRDANGLSRHSHVRKCKPFCEEKEEAKRDEKHRFYSATKIAAKGFRQQRGKFLRGLAIEVRRIGAMIEPVEIRKRF